MANASVFVNACPYRIAPVKGAKYYYVSTNAKVFSTISGRVRELSTFPAKQSGYWYTNIVNDEGKQVKVRLHRIVALAFLEEDPSKPEVAHNDGNKANNNLSNLRFADRASNTADMFRHGTTLKGVKNASAKLCDSQVKMIRALVRNGVAPSRLADSFGVSRPQISAIIHRRKWRHI